MAKILMKTLHFFSEKSGLFHMLASLYILPLLYIRRSSVTMYIIYPAYVKNAFLPIRFERKALSL